MGNSDLGELAARMCAGLESVRACLLLSPDGLTLGAYPSGGEDQGRSAWDKLEAMGSPVRGFVDLGEEVWVIARRGPYTAILVSAPTVRPGLLLDRVEALLRAAEETRVQSAAAPPQSVRRPRTSLHRETAKREAETADREDAPKPTRGKGRTPEPARAASKEAASDSRQKLAGEGKEDATSDEPRYAPPDELASAARNVIDVSELEEEAGAPAGDEAGRAPAPTPTPANGHGRSDIDRVALAREFGRLIADSESQEDR